MKNSYQSSNLGTVGQPYFFLQFSKFPPDSLGQFFIDQLHSYLLQGSPQAIEALISQMKDGLGSNDDVDKIRAVFLPFAAAFRAKYQLGRKLVDIKASALFLLDVAKLTPDGHAGKAMVHDLAATAQLELYTNTGVTDDMATAIQHFTTVVELEPNQQHKTQGHHHVAVLCHALYKESGNDEFLDKCISNARQSLNGTRKVDPEWFNRSYGVSKAQTLQYEKSGHVRDLKPTIKHALGMLDYQPENSVLSHQQLDQLGSALCSAGTRHQDPEILGEAIDIFEDLLENSAMDQELRIEVLYHQGKAYEAKFKVTGDVAYLEVAARQAKEALELTPKSDKAWKSHLFRAAAIWNDLYQKTNDIESLETADKLLKEVLPFLNDGSQEYSVVLRRRAEMSFSRTLHSRSAIHVATAIERIRAALNAAFLDKPSKDALEEWLEALVLSQKVAEAPHSNSQESDPPAAEEASPDAKVEAQAFIERLKRNLLVERNSDDVEATQEWIRQTEEALQKLPLDATMRSYASISLSGSYMHLATRTTGTKRKEYFERATSWLQLQTPTRPTDGGQGLHPALVAFHRASESWKRYFFKRHEFIASGKAREPDARLETDGLLDTAIQSLEEVLKSVMRRIPHLSEQLATAYRHRWARTRDETDLDLAVQVLNRALGNVTLDNKLRQSLLHGMGCVFLDKYRTRGALSDLYAGIRYLAQAAKAPANEGEVEALEYFGSLGEALFALFHRSHKQTHLSLCLSWLDSVAAAPTKDIPPQAILTLLPPISMGYIEKFRITRDLAHVDLAINWLGRSLKMVVALQEDELIIRYAVQLSQAHRDRYAVSGDDKDLRRGVLALEYALKMAPEGGEYLALCLENLGKACKERHGQTGDEKDLRKAFKYLQEALYYDKDWPVENIISGKELFAIYVSQKDWSKAYDVASTIFTRLHRTIGRSLESSDKQALLRQYVGLASDATATALLAGKSASTALQFLEMGRGVIASSLLGLRSELDELEGEHPDLAQQYAEARRQVDYVKRAPRNAAAQWLPVHQPTYRHNATKSLDAIIETIRALPGYNSFVREKISEGEMRTAAAAAGGPIVVINVSRYGCHAIIIREDGVTRHELPDLTLEDIKWRAQKNSAKKMSSDELEWLWDKIVRPVLDILGYMGSRLLTDDDDEPRPRVWWIPTGPLARLPLHAAGYHIHDTTRDGGETALDRVVSSYSLSVGALVQSQASISKVEARAASSSSLSYDHLKKPETVVLVGMDNVQQGPKEVKMVAEICRDMLVKLPTAQTEDLLRALRTADIFHFAGHGLSDDEDPLKSALVLRGQDQLTVSNLFEINLHERRPFLAFLSACHTGKVRRDDALDEGLHLISACQVAGFRHVIGTLWEAQDVLCVNVAQMVYKSMYQQGMGHASVSESLHRATRWARDKWVCEEERKRRKRREREEAQAQRGWNTRPFVSVEEDGEDEWEEGEEDDVGLNWVPYVHYGI